MMPSFSSYHHSGENMYPLSKDMQYADSEMVLTTPGGFVHQQQFISVQ